MWRNALVLVGLALLMLIGHPVVQAQALTIEINEPSTFDSTNTNTFSIKGSGFTSDTTVRIVGVGFIQREVLSSTAILATIPAGAPGGIFDVEVSDPVNGTRLAPNRIQIFAPIPTFPVPTPLAPVTATPLVGLPTLIVRNFKTNPLDVPAGSVFTATFDVVNQGLTGAFGVSVSVDGGAKFFPSNGVASSLLADVYPGQTVTGTLSLSVGLDAPLGANVIPITLSYRDSEGKPYTAKASLSIAVSANVQVPQLTLLTYQVNPQKAQAGRLLVISAQLKNSGSLVASQVLMRVSGESRVLIAGPRGDAFPVGDIDANQSVVVELPLIVAQDAKAGVQPQSFTLSYLQDGKVVETPISIALEVEAITPDRPIILLDNSSVDVDEVRPGSNFTLDLTLKNVGTGSAGNMLVTFGTVQSSGSPDPSGTPGAGGGSSTTNPPNNFAPVASGGTRFVGVLGRDQEVNLTQEFIASATLESGIYAIPLTVQYVRDDGGNQTDTFNATVVVIALPRIQITFDSPLPDETEQFSTVSFALTLTNRSRNPLLLESVEVTGEGIDLFDGARTPVGQLRTDETTSVSATYSPNVEGEYTVTLLLNYTDDLNRKQQLPLTYTLTAVAPPPPFEEPTPDPNATPEPTPTPQPTPDTLFTDLLLGFLGLGK